MIMCQCVREEACCLSHVIVYLLTWLCYNSNFWKMQVTSKLVLDLSCCQVSGLHCKRFTGFWILITSNAQVLVVWVEKQTKTFDQSESWLVLMWVFSVIVLILYNEYKSKVEHGESLTYEDEYSYMLTLSLTNWWLHFTQSSCVFY